MRIDIISVQPALLESPLQHSIMKRAQQKGLLEVHIHNLRDFGLGKHQQVMPGVYFLEVRGKEFKKVVKVPR